MKKSSWSAIVLVLSLCLWGCSARPLDEGDEAMPANAEMFTADTPITAVITGPAFGQFGRLLFPVDDWYYSGDTLGELQLTWYSHIDPQETVDIVNDLKTRASAGQPVFFDNYTEEEKAADPDKEDTGLFYFPGRQGAPFALCSAGGGFAYVGAMQDSLLHALALSQHGYHAFALIYRPGAQSGCEDLARAISFVYSHAEELGISTDCYSLWGGSAGARLSAWLGSYGPAAFGGDDLPRPGAVVMQYTGHSEYTTAAADLCLRGGTRRHRELACHAAAHRRACRSRHPCGISSLSNAWPWVWLRHRNRSGRLAGGGRRLLGSADVSGKGRILCATYFGRGCVREYLGSLCALYQRVMFVCARGELSRSGIGEEVSAILRGEGKHAAVFSGVSSALTYRQVHAGQMPPGPARQT